MIYAKPSTSLLVVFRAYLASDHVTPATGKTIAITISKNGGAFGNPNAGATNATEISSGFYKVTLDTTDTGTAGPLAVRGAVATIDDVGVLYYVGQSPADVTHLLGTAWLTPGTAGTPDVNAKLIGGTAQTGRDIGASVLLSNGTGAGQVSLSSGVINADMVKISTDSVAADNFETMLDGTGGKVLSLGQLVISYDVGGGAGTAAVSISATNGTGASGVAIAGIGSGDGVGINGGETGIGLHVVGGSTSGDGVKVRTISGHAVNLAPVGTSKHGLFVTGGNGGTSDGIKAVAGTGGVPIRGDITGNITGNLSGSIGSYTGDTPQTGDAYARLGAPAGASVSADIAAVKTDTGNLVTRITSSLFSGITSLAQWLGAMAGKQTSDATAQTEMRATGAGSGSYTATTDALEALRDRGDSGAWAGAGNTVAVIIGGWTKSGSTYHVSYGLLVNGVLQTTGLSALSITFRDEDGTDLTFSGTPAAGTGGIINASGTLTTAVTANTPVMVVVGVTYNAVAYTSVLPGATIS